jgi:hypothetical protein
VSNVSKRRLDELADDINKMVREVGTTPPARRPCA